MMSTVPCHEDEFQCESGLECLDPSLRCDEKPHCMDESDEECGMC